MEKILDKFDFGIDNGQILADSNHIWCTSERGLQIKNINQKTDSSSSARPTSPQPYHNFGDLGTDECEIVCTKDFKYFNQYYLLVALKTRRSCVLCVYNVAASKVICAFKIPHQPINLDVSVTIYPRENLISNFTVCAFVGCAGGAIYLIDITPRQDLLSNECQPLDLYLYSSDDQSDDLEDVKLRTVKSRRVFGILLNSLCVNDDNFYYTMPNDEVMAKIANETVKITALRYEKQIDSLLVGFNFGCFQIWNMNTLTVESSSAYAHLNRPVIGFSLLEPQNDPKKCLYLLIAHSSLIETKSKNRLQTHFEYEEDDDNDSDSSFILLYQLNYERKTLVKCNTSEAEIDHDVDYYSYENLSNCVVAFEHDFTSNTLSYSNINEYNYENDDTNICDNSMLNDEALLLSKIISVQTLKVHNNGLDVDIACLCWTLINPKTNTNSSYYLTLFNLNNWYMQCMPNRLDKHKKNMFLNNFILNIDVDYANVKSVSVIESNIKKMKSSQDDSILSIYLEILVLSSFMSIKYTIKPIEEQIKHFINKQEDIFQHQDKIHSLLYRYNLLPVKHAPQEKFLAILNYLLENSELYAIIKSLKKLENVDTSILSNASLKTVLDWTWYRFKETKNEITVQSRKLINQPILFDFKLKQTIGNSMKIIKNLIKIYELFIQLNKSSDGYVELNKKLHLLQSFEMYCEHLNLCLEYSLLPEMLSSTGHTGVCKIFSFELLQESWHEKRKAVLLNTTNKYSFGFIIDCLLADCRPYANISKLLKFNSYPAKSIHEILEIFLECNLTIDIKQLIFLYFLIDVKNNISKEFVLKIDNLVTDYCKKDTVKNNLLNLANGFYHLDDQNVDESYKYFRNCDVNYLQLNEKYRILYNVAYLNKWSKALEFLWLFNNILDDINVKDNSVENVSEIREINSKLLISIYLSNKFISEAYEIIKNFSNDTKIYKQLIVYFLVQSEAFNLWKPVMEFFTSNQAMLQILYSYLEAKQDLHSISTVIDLYLTNHNYKQAIQLYEKYARQIHNSEYSYITSMIEAVKEMQPLNRLSREGSDLKMNDSVIAIVPSDIKEAKLNYSSRDLSSKFSKRCTRLLSEDTDVEHVRLLSLFDVDTVRSNVAAAVAVPLIKPISILTPQKPNISILKSAMQSNTSLTSTSSAVQQLTPGKSVKFKLIAGEEENEKRQLTSEVMEMVKMKEKAFEMHKSASLASMDSAMSTISSRSALNLPGRLADLENDEKLAEMETNEVDNTTKRLSSGSSSSLDSTISSKSGLNMDARLAEVATPSIIAADDDRTEDSCRSLIEDDLFKRPVEFTAPLTTNFSSSNQLEIETTTDNFLKTTSMASFAASTISSKSGNGLAERLEDFESQTIEENFRPLEASTEEVNTHKQQIEHEAIFRHIAANSNQSTISSQSARNLQKRLQDFDNESACDEKLLFSPTKSTENATIQQEACELNTTLQDNERYEEPQILSTCSSEIFQSSYTNVERSSNIDTSPSVSLTLVTPISTNLSDLGTSQATSMLTDDRRIDDEIIFSISDNEEMNNSSFTSISSKCTTNTELSIAQHSDIADVTLTKGKKRRSVGRPSKTQQAAKELLDTTATSTATDGPITRSKLKALSSSRSSMDHLDQAAAAAYSQPDVSITTATRRATRNAKSMTRSPSPTNSVISTASTTVARNSIKRRGSNRVKKPTIILSPTSLLEQQQVEELEETGSETPGGSQRYNLRSRLKTPQKDSVLETLVETAASLTPTVAAKKGRKSVAAATSTKKTSLYKIDEAATDHHPHPTIRHKITDSEFLFSDPTDAADVEEEEKPAKKKSSKRNNSTKQQKKDHDDNQEDDHDSSFTFSPPQSNIKK